MIFNGSLAAGLTVGSEVRELDDGLPLILANDRLVEDNGRNNILEKFESFRLVTRETTDRLGGKLLHIDVEKEMSRRTDRGMMPLAGACSPLQDVRHATVHALFISLVLLGLWR